MSIPNDIQIATFPLFVGVGMSKKISRTPYVLMGKMSHFLLVNDGTSNKNIASGLAAF